MSFGIHGFFGARPAQDPSSHRGAENAALRGITAIPVPIPRMNRRNVAGWFGGSAWATSQPIDLRSGAPGHIEAILGPMLRLHRDQGGIEGVIVNVLKGPVALAHQDGEFHPEPGAAPKIVVRGPQLGHPHVLHPFILQAEGERTAMLFGFVPANEEVARGRPQVVFRPIKPAAAEWSIYGVQAIAAPGWATDTRALGAALTRVDRAILTLGHALVTGSQLPRAWRER
ncbi:MAG: hypothetical protein H6729_15620 [Deltaproteobacteria bacterium]|nr:hypothetical protein [Deltaproteobacteria bacterium]